MVLADDRGGDRRPWAVDMDIRPLSEPWIMAGPVPAR
jgi:hypothetical protein